MSNFNRFSYLWNDLPQEERARLMPHCLEMHILYLLQAKEKAIRHHKAHMEDINRHIRSIEDDLRKYEN